MIPELPPSERDALIWQEGDYIEIRSGLFCVTRAEPVQQQSAAKYVHFLFDYADGGQMSGDMTLSSEIANGPTLLLLIRRGDEAWPIAFVSMVNRAWCHNARFDQIPIYQNTARHKRLGVPPVLSALGPFAQMCWGVGRSMFTNADEEGRLIVDALHTFLHRIAANHTHYWEGGGGTTNGKL